MIVDTNLRTPESVSVLTGPLAKKTIIVTCETNPKVHRCYQLQRATVMVCEEYDGRVAMTDLLHKLGRFGVQTILLEGGSRLAGDMLRHKLIDEFAFFYAPKVVGNGFAPFTLTGVDTMDEAFRVVIDRVGMSGPDVVVHARPEVPCSPA